MELIRANQAIYEELEAFLFKNDTIDGTKLAEYGYVVRIDGKIEGCFVLENTDSENSWLRQLYIVKEQAAKLPVLLEAILQLAREKNARLVHVHSHQPVVDLLLEALQFYPQIPTDVSIKTSEPKGNWWTFNVS